MQHAIATDEATLRAFARARRLAEVDIDAPAAASVESGLRISADPPRFCGWRAVALDEGPHSLAVTWLD
ncbi:MAG: hypothetical protein PVI30_20750 [Myxococcales bacterium]|jgi:hypothetical protein